MIVLGPTGRLLTNFASLIGFAWIGAIAAVTARQRSLLFDPVRTTCEDCPASPCHDVRRVVLHGADGTRLCGWLLTPKSSGPYPGVIYFGGRSEDVSWIAHQAASMFPDMALLAIHHRGFGDSHGAPGERQMMEDGKMLLDWLTTKVGGIDPQRIALVGRSLGSSIAIQLAAHRPVAAIVLMTPFDSVLAMVKKKLPSMPVSWMLWHRFESINYAHRVCAPTLVLRAELDDIVPHLHTDALVSKLPMVTGDEVVPGANHCSIPYLAHTRARIAGFLRQQLLPSELPGKHEAPVSSVSSVRAESLEQD
jgi:dipeptidyl aminopeptidase/acylaminoacyl peptidase